MKISEEISHQQRKIALFSFPLGAIATILYAFDLLENGILWQAQITFFFAFELLLFAVIIFIRPAQIVKVALVFLLSTVFFLFAIVAGNINIADADKSYPRYFIGDSLNGIMAWVSVLFIYSFLVLPRKMNKIFLVTTYSGILLLALYHFFHLGSFEISYYFFRWLYVLVGISGILWLINRVGSLQLYYANYDFLTDIFNRQAIEKQLHTEYLRAKRYGHELSLIIFDIDCFKGINDRYGHLIGDKVLKKITELTLATIRKTDFMGRWGGEEFLILLPNTPSSAALLLAKRLRFVIEENSPENIDQLTASFGVATLQSTWEEEDLLRYADTALYKAKKSGRNQVCVAQP